MRLYRRENRERAFSGYSRALQARKLSPKLVLGERFGTASWFPDVFLLQKRSRVVLDGGRLGSFRKAACKNALIGVPVRVVSLVEHVFLPVTG